jgi:hypothetical protein
MKIKLMKWAINPILISMLILLSGITKSEAATLSIDLGKAEAGQTIATPVRLTNSSGASISSINFDVAYDSKQIRFDEAVAGEAAIKAGKSLSASSLAPGQLRVIIFGLDQNTIANGIVASLSFRINTSAKTGNVALKLENAVASGPQAQSVPLKLKTGRVNIKRRSQ